MTTIPKFGSRLNSIKITYSEKEEDHNIRQIKYFFEFLEKVFNLLESANELNRAIIKAIATNDIHSNPPFGNIFIINAERLIKRNIIIQFSLPIF